MASVKPWIIVTGLLVLPGGLAGQAPLSAGDSALVAAMLAAEDRRDAEDSSLSLGAGHPDSRIRVIARRARERIVDPKFARRDSFPPLPAPPVWPEPAWRLRYRALTAQRNDCQALRGALADSSWAVRLRAADLVNTTCVTDSVIVATLRAWVDSMPAQSRPRAAGGVSWHAGAHGLVALARVKRADARARMNRLARHRQWEVRVYAARAAAILGDTATLRVLARDRDDNVKEAAIDAFARLRGHAEDDVYLRALGGTGAQSVRAAAVALKGSRRGDVLTAANAAYARWAARANDSERDVRMALLEAAGRSAAEDTVRSAPPELPASAVALALGADVRLVVRMATGDSFIVRLRGDAAPIMAARILELARKRYYDGTTWHRVEPDFVIQGGSHGYNEYVGYRHYLRDELGGVPHLRGTVGMSTRGHDTGDAQWFINLRDNTRLDPDYTVFGEVVEGIEAVDGVMEGDRITSIRVVGGIK